MKSYLELQTEETKTYFSILSKDFPEFLNDYIYTQEMQRLDGIEQICEDKFCVSRKVKKRYINQLTKKGRLYDVAIKSKKLIDDFKNMPISKYVYINYK